MSIDATSLPKTLDADVENTFLLYRVGSGLFGTPLLGVREIVKPQPCKPVPNTVESFLGLINLRGEVIGIIDLRKKMNIKRATDQDMDRAYIVFDTDMGPLATLVDFIEEVGVISEHEIERRPNVSTTVPLEYLVGVGKHKKGLVYIIDLKKILGAQDLTKIRGSMAQNQSERG
jgi:purine-binding chemotaxis protein CheW